MTDIPPNFTSPKGLKQRIMRRIYLIFLARNLSPLAFDAGAIAILGFIITLFVSVRDVFANFSVASENGTISTFSINAVAETSLLNKLILIVLGIIGFYAVRHLRRAVKAIQTLRGSQKPEARSSKIS